MINFNIPKVWQKLIPKIFFNQNGDFKIKNLLILVFLLIIAYGSYRIVCNKHRANIFPTVEQNDAENAITKEIDYTLMKCGAGTYIGYEIIEKKNNKYLLSFRMLRGIWSDRTRIVLKIDEILGAHNLQKNQKNALSRVFLEVLPIIFPLDYPVSTKETNPFYGFTHTLDENTVNKFKSMKEYTVYGFNERFVRSEKLLFLVDVYDNLQIKENVPQIDLTLENIYITPIINNGEIVGIVSISFLNEKMAKCYEPYSDARKALSLNIVKTIKLNYNLI